MVEATPALREQPPSGGCVLKLNTSGIGAVAIGTAAFGRLCVETTFSSIMIYSQEQPPSGGCVLKQGFGNTCKPQKAQPPSGGCVLKLTTENTSLSAKAQPPSGGCVLKRFNKLLVKLLLDPAAFRRLCVETGYG